MKGLSCISRATRTNEQNNLIEDSLPEQAQSNTPSLIRVFGRLSYCLTKMGHNQEMHAQKKALPSQSTEAKLILPKILFIRGERFLSCRNSDARAFQNRDSLQMCYDVLHHGLFTAQSGRSHCIGASKHHQK